MTTEMEPIYVVDLALNDDDYRQRTLAYCRSKNDAELYVRRWASNVGYDVNEGREATPTVFHYELFRRHYGVLCFQGDLYINQQSFYTP